MPVVITDIPRPPEALVQAFEELDVATVHEAQGRKGYWLLACVRSIVQPRLSHCHHLRSRPRRQLDDSRCCGAVPSGDILLVAPTSPSEDGCFGVCSQFSASSRSRR